MDAENVAAMSLPFTFWIDGELEANVKSLREGSPG